MISWLAFPTCKCACTPMQCRGTPAAWRPLTMSINCCQCWESNMPHSFRHSLTSGSISATQRNACLHCRWMCKQLRWWLETLQQFLHQALRMRCICHVYTQVLYTKVSQLLAEYAAGHSNKQIPALVFQFSTCCQNLLPASQPTLVL